jgi:hypothetical protein
MQFLRRTFEAWPYVFIAVSLVGLAYIIVNSGIVAHLF